MASVKQLVNRITGVDLPVFRRELRGANRHKHRIARILICVAVVLIPMAGWRFSEYHRLSAAPMGPLELSGECLACVFLAQLGVICLLVPLNGAAGIARERELHTFDLLAVTPLSSSAIIGQKLMASIADVMFLLLASIPLVSVLAAWAKVEPAVIVAIYGLLLATMLFVAAMGIFWSCYLVNARTAASASYAGVVGAYAGVTMFWRRVFGWRGHGVDLELVWGIWSGPVLLAICLAVVSATMIVLVHSGYGGLSKSVAALRTRAAALARIGSIPGAVLFLAAALYVVPLTMDMYASDWECLIPLSAVADVGYGVHRPDLSVTVATLLFSIAAAALLLQLSIQRLEALRRS